MQNISLSNEEGKTLAASAVLHFVKSNSLKNDSSRLWVCTPQYLLQIHEQKYDVDDESLYKMLSRYQL
jgi:hypothetical protein